jgi:Bacterial Ig domain
MLTVRDAANNSASDSLDVTVRDTVQPTLQVLSPSEGDLVSSNDVIVRWSAADEGLGLARFEVNLDGGTALELSPSTTSHTFDDVADGPHAIGITAVDGSNNRRSSSVGFVVDATAPSVSILSPAEGAVLSASTIGITWQASDATTDITGIEVRLDQQAPVALSATEADQTFTGLTEGAHSVTVTAVDQAGHEGSATLQFSVDLPDEVRPLFSEFELVLLGVAVVTAGAALIIVWSRRRRKLRP